MASVVDGPSKGKDMKKWLTETAAPSRVERLLVGLLLVVLLVGLPGPCRVALLDVLATASPAKLSGS